MPSTWPGLVRPNGLSQSELSRTWSSAARREGPFAFTTHEDRAVEIDEALGKMT